MAHTATCPSGLTVVLRKLKTKEANVLADAAGVRKGTTFDEILKACTMEVQDPGLYTLGASGVLDWRKVLVCDRFFSLVQLRIATYGPEYAFDIQCTAQFCREKIKWEIDLTKDMKFKDLPTESRQVFKDGNRFETTIPSLDRAAWFRLMTGDDEAKASKQARGRKSEIMTLALASRIIEIDGVDGNDKLRFIDNMDLDDATALIDAMDEVDGGLDTNIEVDCPHCGATNEVALPFDRGFWLPSKRRPETTKETEQT